MDCSLITCYNHIYKELIFGGDGMKTVEEKVKDKLRRASQGTLFSLDDFQSAGTYESVKKTVNTLVGEGSLIRVYKGIYQKPKFSEFLNMTISASPREIAEKYAQKYKWDIAPAGDIALNILGLDTQVPHIYEYISDGPNRTITLDNGTKITFKHVLQKETKLSRNSSLVIEALKHLGKEAITDEDLKKILSKLDSVQFKQLQQDSKNTRVWIQELIKRMGEFHV